MTLFREGLIIAVQCDKNMETAEIHPLDSILEEESILTHFQPIVSVKRKKIVAYEALSRGIIDGMILSPMTLFQMAVTMQDRLMLDRLCRKKALQYFSPVHSDNKDLLVSINLDTGIVHLDPRSDNLMRNVDMCGIEPANVIIEILESEIADVSALDTFIRKYKRLGFIIAIDDVGSGFSNWDRLFSVEPHLVKIDRSLIHGIKDDFYKQEIVSSLTQYSHKIGSLVVAEGVEREDDAIESLKLGADMLQGYVITKPAEYQQLDHDSIHRTINRLGDTFKEATVRNINSIRLKQEAYTEILNVIRNELKEVDIMLFESIMAEKINRYPIIECMYALDVNGIQITNTICSVRINECATSMFKPDSRGADQSYKNYYYYLMSGLSKFVSEPYISYASGNMCVTISLPFCDRTGTCFILCVDFRSTDPSVPIAEK